MYPHILYSIPVTGSRNSDGYAVTSEGTAVKLGCCRFEPSGKEQRTVLDDGTHSTQSGVIYAPATIQAVCEGTLIKVTDDDGDTLFKGYAVNSVKSQLHTRIWV